MIPNAEKCWNEGSNDLQSVNEINYKVPILLKEFAKQILEYNLDEYKNQLLQFNTGDASNFKTFEQISIETINKLK